METVIIYEYVVHKGKFEKREHHATVEMMHGENIYRFRTKNGKPQCIYTNAMEHVYNNRIFSFIDDLEKYKGILTEYFVRRAISHYQEFRKNLDVILELDGAEVMRQKFVHENSCDGKFVYANVGKEMCFSQKIDFINLKQ